MARRPRAAPVPPVTWRDGVHLTGTPIWCDARRRRDVCFVSSADRVVRAGHGQLIGTPTTIALVADRDSGHLAVPVRRPFTLGTLRLELIPSGRTVGAAALHVDTGMRTVLYAAAIRTAGTSEAAEVRASDAVVVSAPVGEPHHRFAPIDDVADRVASWARTQLAAGKAPVIVVDTALDGLEVATRLVAAGLAVAAAKSLRDAAAVLGDAAPALRAPGREPAVVIRSEADRARPVNSTQAVAALVSARALDPQRGWDATFAWPFVASRDQLLAWIEQARAKHVFVTGPCAESVVAALGPHGRVLGPPQQMALFSS
jgi:putative mRNA 3-end processing factor